MTAGGRGRLSQYLARFTFCLVCLEKFLFVWCFVLFLVQCACFTALSRIFCLGAEKPALLRAMDGLPGKDMDMDADKGKENENAMDKGQQELQGGKSERIGSGWAHDGEQKGYSREATLIVSAVEVNEVKAEDVIKSLIGKVGITKVLAVRPRMNKEYEMTLENEEVCENLKDGLIIKGILCKVRSLQTRECIVSFMHLPAYIMDEEIISKLNVWGVTATSQIKRRYYLGTRITDGTRYVRVKFPKEVPSLPYSTRFETAEGAQHFRIIHDRQVKLCRLCMEPGHIMKDCPEFKCHDCGEMGHFARECDAVRCPDCRKVLIKCECWMEQENEEGIENVVEEIQNEEEVEEEQTEAMEEEEGQKNGEMVEKEQEDERTENKNEEQESLEGHEEEKKMERGRKDDYKKGWEKVITRRRQIKVSPNIEKAKRRHLRRVQLKDKETSRKESNENRFAVLSGTEDEIE